MRDPRFRTHAIAANDSLWADAGFKAVVSCSALVVSCASVASVFESWLAAPIGAAVYEKNNNAIFSSGVIPFDTVEVSPAILATPEPPRATLAIPPAARVVAVSQNALALAADADLLAAQPLEAAKVSFDESGRLLLHASDTGFADIASQPDASPDTPIATGASERLRALADNLVADWQAPQRQQQDIALFVASEDEALSWSLNRASPNHGALAYNGEQVELGELAVGVSMSVGDARVAAAYVEREYSAPFRGADSLDENFAGLTLTYRN